MSDTKNDLARGIFITFEGGEGVGKTTHIRFLTEALQAHDREVVCLREPGGTSIGEQLRTVVLDPQNSEMNYECELLIYEAARAQLVSTVIAPALARGQVVLCDRFCDSTLAYQAFARGLDRRFVQQVNDFASQGIRPDRTILLSTGDSGFAGLKRAVKRSGADRLEREGASFHARVQEAFDQLAKNDPGRIRKVLSTECKSATATEVFSQLKDLFPWMGLLVKNNPAYFESLDAQREQICFSDRHQSDKINELSVGNQGSSDSVK